jgi:hypothetical protein
MNEDLLDRLDIIDRARWLGADETDAIVILR